MAGKQQILPAHISGKTGGWVEWPTWEASRQEELRIEKVVHVEHGGGKSKFVNVVRVQILLISRSHEYIEFKNAGIFIAPIPILIPMKNKREKGFALRGSVEVSGIATGRGLEWFCREGKGVHPS